MMMGPSVRVIFAGLLSLGCMALAGACQKKPAGETQVPARDTAQQKQRIAEGQRAYLSNCAICHGEWGEGNGPLAAELEKAGVVVAVLNDRVRLQEVGRGEVMRVIRRGGAHTGRSNLMPPWGERLAPDVIERIADFVMVLPDLHPGTPRATMAGYLEAPPGVPAQGRKLFLFYCTPCHGPYGKGDGHYADTIWARDRIRPRNLTDSAYFAKKTDQELFALVSLGGAHFRKSTYMPPWNVTLSPREIKDLVSYARSLSRTPPTPRETPP